ncbi:MAG: PspC domain-containing protein [Patescibacteria group bacterium]|nr:PspC domain-containing protein [Patescibacteria group bacterium]
MPAKKEYMKKLYRSEKDRIIGGVAGGLGEYLEIDPTLIRIIFVLLTVFGGSGILIYIILWILVPSEEHAGLKSEDYIKKNTKEMGAKAKSFADGLGMSSKDNSKSLLGLVIIVVGLFFLFGNLGFVQFRFFWPLLLILVGLFLLAKDK